MSEEKERDADIGLRLSGLTPVGLRATDVDFQLGIWRAKAAVDHEHLTQWP